MKKIYATLFCICMAFSPSLFAQTPLSLTIKEIQSVSGVNLANCNDSSRYTGKLVYVQGVVVTAPTLTVGSITGINAPGSMACSGAFYIQDGTGPFSGILVRQSLTKKGAATGILGLSVGDSVGVQGTVREYANTIIGGHNYPGETHIDLDTTVDIQTLDFGRPVQGPTVVNVSDLGDAFVGNKLVTGEQWEGVFVKLVNVNVSDRPGSTSGTNSVPNACVPATGSRRRRFTVVDSDGNKIIIGDRFLAGRFSSPATANNSPGASGNAEIGLPGGSLMYPEAGSSYISISGIVSHWLNSPSGSSCSNRLVITPDGVLGFPQAPDFQSTASKQGYVINPFLPSHYQLGRPLPVISGVKTFVGSFANGLIGAVPPANTVFNVQATITQSPAPSGAALSFVGATLYYTTDPISNSNPSWTSVAMQSTFQGNDYYAEIPGFPEGTLVRYYIAATNSDPAPKNVTYLPNPSLAKYYTVRNSGLTIYDLQYTPYSDGNSIFAGANGAAGQIVTVSGVVTSAIKDLGVVYIQQENVQEWGGITVFPQNAITNSPVASIVNALSKLKRGQKVTIVGTVSETFSQTTLNATKVITLSGVGNITTIRLQASTFASNDQEKYEGMLVTLVNQPFQKIKVVEPKFAGARGSFRVGSNLSNSASGTLVMTGVQDSRYQVWTYGSLNTNYLRSKNREFGGNDGILGANIATFDTVTTATTLDSLTGLVLYNFNNQILTPRDNNDFHGVSNVGSVWNAAANPANLAATKVNSTAHSLQWSIPAGYGGDGFVIDYAAPSSSLPPSTAGPYYPLKLVSSTDSIVSLTNLSPNSGALYRLRGYRIVDGNYVYSTPLQSNIAGTFVVITSQDDATVNTKNIQVYPNPMTSGAINYSLNVPISGGFTYSVFDITGKIVSNGIISNPSSNGTLNLSDVPTGHYTLELNNGQNLLFRAQIIRLD